MKSKRRRTPPDWMAINACNIINMLPEEPEKARAVLEYALELVDYVPERGMRYFKLRQPVAA
jgi:hypothetical protein